MTLERGTLLHKRYRIVEILGQGGMGSIYRAVDENLGVEVAVKDNLFTTEEYARQFRLEAVILASLRHANLPRVTDHFVIGEQGQYLVMDYIEGEDLRQRMERQGTIPEDEAIQIGAAMCDALQYLHSRKPSIVHRDVKPGNVKITSEGHIYLVDFGLAKVVRGNQATTTGARAMTPGYSPPEQYGTARTDPRSDIYSLGATLYAALSGVIPEDGLARAMDNVELTPLRKRNAKISRRLAQAIEKAMAVRPEDRFQTADDFKQALLASTSKTQLPESRHAVEPLAPTVSTPHAPPEKKSGKRAKRFSEEDIQPPEEPPVGPSTRKKPGWAARFFRALVFLILLAIIVAGYFYRAPLKALILERINPLLPPTATVTSRALPTSTLPASALVPSKTALPVTRTPRASQTPHSSQTPEPSLTSTPSPTLPPEETIVPSLTPIPTEILPPTATLQGGGYGQILFASTRAGLPQLFIINADGSDLRQLTDLPDGACQPDWSPDGTRVVYISPCRARSDSYPGAHMFLMNIDGSEVTALPAADAGDFDPAWSPDGKQIAFTSLRDGSPQIYLLKLVDNSLVHLGMGSDIKEARQPDWSPAGTQIVYTVRRLGLLQVWVMNYDGTGQEQLVRSGSDYFDFKPTWSPDGQIISFTQSKGPVTIGWLMHLRYDLRDSQGASRINNGNYAIDVEYSPDGQWLVFESLDGQNYNISLMKVDGTGRKLLTTDPAIDFDPTWRPLVP